MNPNGVRSCAHCVAERAAKEEVDFRTKYTLAVISTITLVIGIIVESFLMHSEIALVFFLITILAAGRWVIPNGIRSIIRIHLGISFLMTVAAFGAVLIGEPAEGAAVMFLFYIAELLEEKAGERVRKEFQTLVELEPASVTIKVNGSETCIRVEDAEVSQIMIVRPGERIGMDGIVVNGASSVNQAPITGESIPVTKTTGDVVYAGTLNQEGYLEIEITKPSEDTILAKIIELVQESQKKKSQTERFVERFSHVYTPIVVVGAFLLGLVTFLFGNTLQDSLYRGLTLLVISCPCAFAISIPISMVSTIAGAAREGVLVKGAEYIEAISNAKTVAFDKTGTLTEGRLSVGSICTHNGFTDEEILQAGLSMEQMSQHPIALAIINAAEERGVTASPVDDWSSVAGRGVIGKVSDVTYVAGKAELLEKEGIVLDLDEEHSCGVGTIVHIAKGDSHMGAIVLQDHVRSTTKEALEELNDMNIETVMLTGDSTAAAKEVAEYLKIDQYFADLLPDDKVTKLEEISRKGPVIMIGDGVNDAPALATADVGIAMGVIGSDVALETADVALMKDDLSQVLSLIHRAKKTMRIVRQNVVVAIGLKLVLVLLAVLGSVPLWVAIAVGDMGLTLAVISNALRLIRKN